MTSPGYGRHLDLDDGDTLNLDDARGTTLRVTRGRLWVTQHHDSRDIVLTAGDTWTVERNGRTIAMAQDDSSLSLIGDAVACVDTRRRRPSWMARFVAWLERVESARGRRWAPYL